MLAEGLVCVDTNVLLDLYRFTPSARADLIHVLERLGDRLFVPYQVALEFQRRRFDAIQSQQSFFDEKVDQLNKHVRSVESMTKALVKGLGASDADLAATSDTAIAALRGLAEQIREMQREQDVAIPSDTNDEPIQEVVIRLLSGRTGHRPSAEDLDTWHREADKRYAERIPPGFEDAGKSENNHGDYLLWRELLNEAQRRDLPVTLVSREEKVDWVRRNGPTIFGPLPELVDEMLEVAGVRFALMSPTAFLEEARTALSVAVEDSTVSQAGEPQSRDIATRDGEFSKWLLSHPEVLGVKPSVGGVWRNADLERLLGTDLVDQLEPFRGHGRVIPKSVLVAAWEAKLLAAKLQRLRQNEAASDEFLNQDEDERMLAELRSEEIVETEARLRDVLLALPGVDPLHMGSGGTDG